jgi:hypothetical protein
LIAITISFAQWLVCGLAAALLIDPSSGGRRLVGTAFLLGSGIAAFTLLALSLAGVRWTATSSALLLAAVTLALWFAGVRRRRASPPRERRAPETTAADRIAAAAVDLVTLLLIAGHAVYATLAPVAEWDFWAIWGLKARTFIANGGIDWAYLEHPFNAFTHPDYPILLPLDYAWITLFGEGWSDRWLGILTTAFGAALLLILRDLFEEELRGRTLAALATLAVASFSLSPWIGMAEGPLVAFGGAGLLIVRRGLMKNDGAAIASGSVLLGLAGFTKNEGLSLIIAAIIAAFLYLGTRRREVVRLWPSVALAAPWLLLRAIHGLQTDLASGSVAERATQQLQNLPALTSALADNLPDEPLFWIAVAAAILLFARRELRIERFVVAAVVIQVLFYIAAYVVTPNELRWHVASSWVRLLEQVAVPAGFVAVTILGRVLEGADGEGYSSTS